MALKQRNHAFDLLCGICILRMIVLHVAGFCGMRGDFWCGKMMAWTFFFMSFFFFKAGYFNKTVSGNSKAYCIDRTKRLLVPYISWTIIGDAIFFGMMLFNLDMFMPYLEKRVTWEHNIMISRPYGNAPVWFLFSFYVAYLFMHFIGKVKHLRWIIVTFPFVSYWLYQQGNPLPMSLSNVFLGIFFFFLGRLWKWVMNHVPKAAVLAISAVFIGLFVYLNIHYHGEYDMSLNKYVQRPVGAIVNSVLSLCGFAGILLSLPVKRVPVVNFIGEHSMVYFVAHYPLLIIYHLTHRLFHHTMVGHWEDFILCLAFILVTCTWLVPKIEGVPWLSGRYKKGK